MTASIGSTTSGSQASDEYRETQVENSLMMAGTIGVGMAGLGASVVGSGSAVASLGAASAAGSVARSVVGSIASESSEEIELFASRSIEQPSPITKKQPDESTPLLGSTSTVQGMVSGQPQVAQSVSPQAPVGKDFQAVKSHQQPIAKPSEPALDQSHQ